MTEPGFTSQASALYPSHLPQTSYYLAAPRSLVDSSLNLENPSHQEMGNRLSFQCPSSLLDFLTNCNGYGFFTVSSGWPFPHPVLVSLERLPYALQKNRPGLGDQKGRQFQEQLCSKGWDCPRLQEEGPAPHPPAAPSSLPYRGPAACIPTGAFVCLTTQALCVYLLYRTRVPFGQMDAVI